MARSRKCILCIALNAALWMNSPSIFSCSCSPQNFCEMIQRSVIFVGEVIEGGITSIRQDPWYDKVPPARLRVLEAFRGLPKDQKFVDIFFFETPGMCGPNPYHLGRKYLIASDGSWDALIDGGCTNARDIEKNAELLQQMREYFLGKMPINVHGRVAAMRGYHSSDSDVSPLLDKHEAKPLAGVKISASGKGKTYTTTTDKDGRYTLLLPNSGTYKVAARLHPYFSDPLESDSDESDIPEKACAIRDFGLKILNTISGRVLDEKGQPVGRAVVGLVGLDPLNPNAHPSQWITYESTDESDGSFTFENVPIGRYLLQLNPHGPQANAPYESVYYPFNSTREHARMISIGKSGRRLTGMDLIAGKAMPFRRVHVRIRYADGTPMKMMEIVCTGLPRQKEDLEWSGSYGTAYGKENSGEIEFLAPANRQLKLTVKDLFSRSLNGNISSLHERGIAPIVQEFIITP
jgi:hypothetical protein